MEEHRPVAYSDLLLQAYEKGWRYPRNQIENGFKRPFEELKLQLIAQGYTIISEDAEYGSGTHQVQGTFDDAGLAKLRLTQIAYPIMWKKIQKHTLSHADVTLGNIIS